MVLPEQIIIKQWIISVLTLYISVYRIAKAGWVVPLITQQIHPKTIRCSSGLLSFKTLNVGESLIFFLWKKKSWSELCISYASWRTTHLLTNWLPNSSETKNNWLSIFASVCYTEINEKSLPITTSKFC